MAITQKDVSNEFSRDTFSLSSEAIFSEAKVFVPVRRQKHAKLKRTEMQAKNRRKIGAKIE
ncbi:hypothetical protein RO3G_06515 [Rhizopus delemar RA 99-880]|uniref:Uncharacterized protein n=1 Tax=Rhizopus delemar (strain RA 99-880 / ATCC MYA-4621 / FGSC 9543 / NRRL 43880) TaxID=246409 RepID=I1C030_RHIO9|nr:hypothetical protein RO3G_06515 [Rhizopus delemar RA 99-880]|eukprot:EIE81810.1 hypothetical protein RO3G_06515 [Rhizopus delemar RA 99-880]